MLPVLGDRGWRIDGVARPEGGVWLAGRAGDRVDYPEDGHELLLDVEGKSAWFAERNRLIAAALAPGGLPREFVEIGAGNGFVTAHLRSLGVDAVAVEPGRGAAEASARRGVPTVCGLLDDLALPDGSVEAAGVFDVLEHVADTGPLLHELHRVLVPGGRLVVTVPAMPSLWSRTDELSGHHRRYRRQELVAELAGAGFAMRACRYAFAALVPVVALARALPYRLGYRRDDVREAAVGTRQVAGYGDIGHSAARAAFATERAARRVYDVPAGTSLVAVFARSEAR